MRVAALNIELPIRRRYVAVPWTSRPFVRRRFWRLAAVSKSSVSQKTPYGF